MDANKFFGGSKTTTSAESGIDIIKKLAQNNSLHDKLVDAIENDNGKDVAAIFAEKGHDAGWQAGAMIDAHDFARKYKLAVAIPMRKGGEYVLFYNTDKDLINLKNKVK